MLAESDPLLNKLIDDFISGLEKIRPESIVHRDGSRFVKERAVISLVQAAVKSQGCGSRFLGAAGLCKVN